MQKQNESYAKSESIYSSYISERLECARNAKTSRECSSYLAEAIAANGLWQFGIIIGKLPDRPNIRGIELLSNKIQNYKAFQSLTENGKCKNLAEAGNIEIILNILRQKDLELAEEQLTFAPAEVISDILLRIHLHLATEWDFAELVAAYNLASIPLAVEQHNGKYKNVVHYNWDQELDNARLREETERVLHDPDFQYYMRNESPLNLITCACSCNGVQFPYYSERVKRMREPSNL